MVEPGSQEAALSKPAARLLAVLPARRVMTAKRAAHYAGLPGNCIGVAVRELVAVGLVDQLGSSRIRRSELSRFMSTMERLEGTMPNQEDEAG